jgi:hypothetical protein
LSATRMRAAVRSLFGHKAKPRRELKPVLERASVADRSDQGDSFDLGETLADLVFAIELSDLLIVTRNPRIHFDQLFPQLSYKQAKRGIRGSVIGRVRT